MPFSRNDIFFSEFIVNGNNAIFCSKAKAELENKDTKIILKITVKVKLDMDFIYSAPKIIYSKNK